MGMKVNISYTTPTQKRNVRVSDFKALGNIIVNQAVMKAQTATVEMASAAVAGEMFARVKHFLQCVAIVFQRIVARTPLDEDYEMANGDIHRADANVMRNDWVCTVTLGNSAITITPKMFPSDTFSVVNDRESIKKILSVLVNSAKKIKVDVYGTKVDIEMGVDFKNDNDHFNKLEYGTARRTSGHEPYKGKGREHGLIEGWSVQAPSGFFRLTMLEFEDVLKSTGKTRTMQNKLYHHLYDINKNKGNLRNKMAKIEADGYALGNVLGKSRSTKFIDESFRENFNTLWNNALNDSEVLKEFENLESEKLEKLNAQLTAANMQMNKYAGIPAPKAQQKYKEFEKSAKELKKEIAEHSAGKTTRWNEFRKVHTKGRKRSVAVKKEQKKADAFRRKSAEYKSPENAARRAKRRETFWRKEYQKRAKEVFGTQLLLPPPIKKNGRSARKK